MEKECAYYFKNKKGFYRIFEGLKRKYRSLGNLGGVIRLDNLSHEEKDALSGLFGRDYYKHSTVDIKVEQIVRALENTKFQGVNLELVVREYYGEELISKKEEKKEYEAERRKYYDGIVSLFDDSISSRWLKFILESRKNPYRLLNLHYRRDREQLYSLLINVMKALDTLTYISSSTIRLGLLASKINRDPHYFDDGTSASDLLLYGISHILDLPYPRNAEERSETLYRGGIIRDEISNQTTSSGLLAVKEGKIHPAWEGFYKEVEPITTSLWNLSKVDKIINYHKNVFIFENPTVFSDVLFRLNDINPPLVCSNGQLRLATLILLDKLYEEVDYIYYSGDFDPEGLRIAEKLKNRYGDKLIFWRLNIEEYEKIKSQNTIKKSSLSKLKNIKSPELKDLSEWILKEKRPAYQELLIDKYEEDIKRLISNSLRNEIKKQG